MSVKQLKAAMAERSIPLTGCVEKKDMVTKLEEAAAARPAKEALSSLPSAPSSSAAATAGTASKKLVELQGMVDRDSEDLHDDELYADLLEDVRGECEKFGTVTALAIPRPKRTEDGSGFLYGNRYVCRVHGMPP
jgi:hypothetical protein